MKMTDKAMLRRQVRDAFPGMAERDAQSAAICRVLASLPALQTADCVAGYIALPREADILPMLTALQQQGKRIALPCVDADGRMVLREMPGPARLVPDAYGIPSPPSDMPQVDPAAISVILTPLEAIDPQGHRLGKGGGYYDRLLAGRHALTIGVALTHQLVPLVPSESHDVPLDACALPSGILYFT